MKMFPARSLVHSLVWSLRLAVLALVGISASVAHAQTAARIYEFNNSYAETNGGSAMVPNGGTLSATGYTFAAGQGPSVINALANTGEYSIELLFRIDAVSSFRNLLNFNNRTSDNAVYCSNGTVFFYNYSTGNSTTTDFVAGQTHRLVITRNATTKVTTAYVDGVQKGQVTDVNNFYVASGTSGILHFFRDDGAEHPTGFVDQIRIYNAVLTSAQVAALGSTLPAWQAVVNAGSPVTTHYTAVSGSSPISLNVGSFSTGSARSFEFVFTAVGAGPTKTLLGSNIVASGNQYLKFHQWNNTGKFGLSTAGVADYVFANSPTISNQQVHAVYTSNGTVTTLYLNGVAQTGTINEGLKVTGLNGLGAFLNSNQTTFQDNLDGTINGFASYARALTQAEVTARYNALVGGTTTAPEIQLKGNATVIVDGDTTPSATDHTHFGTVTTSLARTFTIENTGTAALTISSIAVSGTHAAQFVVSGAPTSVAVGASATFTVTFTPGSGSGERTATITVNNNDANEAVSDFAIAGTAAAPAPEIQLKGNATVIVDGDTTPSAGDHTHFGTVTSSLARTFTIENTGTAALTISSIIASGTHAAQFVVSGAPTSVAAGASATFTVTFTPGSGSGERTATITVNNNDADEAVSDFAIAGTAVAVSNVTATYTTGAEVPVTAGSFTATGGTANFTLNYAPVVGTELMVVKNTGLGFINGTFGNLAHGQAVDLTFGGVTYQFVANYFGGSGNDLVLQWANTRALAWGSGAQGQLGIGTTLTYNTQPAVVRHSGSLAGKTVLAVSSGFNSSLALCADGTVHAWGQNSQGQLGDNSTTNRLEPVAVVTTGVLAGKTVVAIASGEDFQLVLCADGTLAAWGNNQTGQLGNGTFTSSSVPVLVNRSGVLAGKSVVAISAGAYHGLALCSDGTVAGWGFNPLGQLGNNATANSSSPVLVNTAGVLAGKTVSAISAGAYFGLALCSDGTLVAWGDNRSRQLGNNSTAESSLVPVLVDTSGVLAGKTVVSVAAGRSHSVVLCADGTLAAWGYNGQASVGDGTTTDRTLPVLVNQAGVLAGKSVTKVWAGYEHNVALCSDGTLAAWGTNGYGQLGNNTQSTPTSPVLVSTATLPPGARFTSGNAKLLHSVGTAALPPPPALSTISPAAGGVAAGTRVTLNGLNLTGVTGVTVNGVAATNISFVNDTQILANFPAGVVGPASVLVTTPAGTNAANSLYTYMPAPSVTGISPNRGTINGGTSVTLSGTGFTDVSSVQFGGVAGTITSSSPTSITVVTPARAVGAANVSVATPYGNFTSTNGFTYIVPPPGEVDPLNVSIVGTIVLATAVQPDGSTLIAGNFSQVLGANRNHIVRVLADGALDSSFNPNPNGPVTSVAVQSDGKILLGGQFTALQPNGAASATTRNRLARLNADGTLDATFNPNANATVQAVVPQADGRILVGGLFNTLQPNGAASPTTRNRVARLNADGTLDATFDPNANDEVLSLAVQGDGRIVLAGRFTSLQPAGAASAATRNRVARVNADGTLDATFNPNANGAVNTLAVQSDGRVVLGGAFASLQPTGAASPTNRSNIARVLADGSLDTTFDPSANGAVNSLALQADGRVLFGGAFTAVQPHGAASPTTRNRVARVNADGTLDATFDPAANNTVFSVALRADGAVLLGGFFTALQPNGATTPVTRDYFVRLLNDTATQSLSTPDSSRVLWSRGGSSPALTTAIFEVSTNAGSTWTPLPGTATRVGTSADWELLNTDIPATGLLRARGRTAGSFQSAGSGLVEQQATYTAPVAPPVVTAVSSDRGTTLGGDTVTITGSRFTGASAVTIGGNAAPSFSVVNASTITAVTPAGTAGPVAVRVTGPSGTSATNTLFTYVAPPTVVAVSPVRGSTVGGSSVVISGTGFTNVTGVSIGGNAASYVVNSATQITAVTPVGVAGAARVTVTVAGATSAPNSLFTYVAPPTLTSVSPTSGSILGGQSVTLTGTNFSLATGVTFGGVAAASFTVDSATQITAVTPVTTAGPQSVVVTTPGGSATATTPFTTAAPPAVTSVSPALGSTVGGNTITVTGTGFSGATNVTIGGDPATSFTVQNATTLTATTPAGTAGTASVAVTGAFGTSAPNALFTYVVPPTLTSVSPAAGSTFGGQSVTLTGTNFSLATSVTFGGVAAASFTVDSATQITAVTPATTAGAKSVVVSTPGGSATTTTQFTFNAPSTTTTLVSSQSPSVFLTPPTFTARAVSAQPGLTGQIALSIDNVVLESKAIDASGYATFTPSPAALATGSREIRAAFTGGSGVTPSSATLTQVVTKSPVVITLGALSAVYDGTAKSATATTDVPSGYTVNVALTYNGSATAPVNAGTYAVAASITHPNFQGTATGQLVIAKAPLTFTVSTEPLVYNGSPRVPSITVSPAGVPVTVTYQSSVGGVATGTASSVAPTLPGQYIATVATSSPNHQLTTTTFAFEVRKAPASVIYHGTSQVYDGTPRRLSVFLDPLGIPLTLTYQSMVNGVPTGPVTSDAPVNVGRYLVTASSPNHQLTPATTVMNVSKRAVAITLKGLFVAIDGQPKPVTVTTDPANVPVTVTYTANGTTTTTAPSAPPAGGSTWRVDVVPTDTNSYAGSATGLLRIDPRRQPTVTLTGPAVSTTSSAGTFVATLGNLGPQKPTGSVYFSTRDGFGLFSGVVGPDGKAIMARTDFFLPVRSTPYEMVAEYSGDANYLTAVSNTHVNRIEKESKIFAEYNGNLTYTGRPAVIPPSRLAYLYYHPNLVRSYQITYNGSTTLPTNVTTSPVRVEIKYETGQRDADYKDVINLNILKASARIKVSNLRQNASASGNPVQITTDPAGLATQVTYNGVALPNGPSTPGTYRVVASLLDPNYELYNAVEATGTLVLSQNTTQFTVTNLFQNYDGRQKTVSVTASPSIPYIVTYNGSTRPPIAPGIYDVRVYPEDTARYGDGSSHTLVIKARVSATVNNQANTTNLRIKDGYGNVVTSFPAYLNPSQNEWTLEFIESNDLKFSRWSDGSKENPRRISLGGPNDPASYTFNAEAGRLYFLEAQAVKTGLPAGTDGIVFLKGYYAPGQMAQFEATTIGEGAIINRWEYAGKVVTPADGHVILRDGREVYIKVRADGGNPICHFTRGHSVSGLVSLSGDAPGGRVELIRKDYPNLPPLSRRFIPYGVNFVATAKPESGFLFSSWGIYGNARLADPLKRSGALGVPGFPRPTTTEEFEHAGTPTFYSAATSFLIKDGPEFFISISGHQREVSAGYNGVDIAGLRTATVHIENKGSTTSGIVIKRIQVIGFRLKRFKNSNWTYYYPFDRNKAEIDANDNSPMTSAERALFLLYQPVIVNNEALNFWTLDLFSNLADSFADPLAVDYDVGTLGNRGKKEISIVLGGLAQDVNFGPQAEAEVRLSFTLETARGTQFVDAWWMDFIPGDRHPF